MKGREKLLLLLLTLKFIYYKFYYFESLDRIAYKKYYNGRAIGYT